MKWYNSNMSDKNTKVTIYSTTWCAFCHTEMQWMDKLGIPYEAKDIEADETAKKELLDKLGGNFRGVPVTDVAGEIILGFDRPRLQAAFEKENLLKT
jgi:glutaredoxin